MLRLDQAMNRRVAPLAKTDEVAEVIEFVSAMLVGPMVGDQIELAIAGLAPESGALFHLELDLLPVVGLEIISVALL